MEPERAEDARFEAVLNTVQRLVQARDAEARVATDRRGFLAEGALAPADLEQFAQTSDRRLLLYRKLIRSSLTRAVALEIPRSAARLEDAFETWVARFLEEEGPRSHYLRDVAFELVAWARPRWAEDPTVPSYLGDLALHELADFEVASAPPEERGPSGVAMELDLGVRFDASTRLYRYAYAVHRLLADEDARDVPSHEPTALLAYRTAEHEVRYLALTPLAATILERLLAGATLRAGVTEGAAAHDHPLDGAVLGSTAALLDDLEGRGVVLGAEPR